MELIPLNFRAANSNSKYFMVTDDESLGFTKTSYLFCHRVGEEGVEESSLLTGEKACDLFWLSLSKWLEVLLSLSFTEVMSLLCLSDVRVDFIHPTSGKFCHCGSKSKVTKCKKNIASERKSASWEDLDFLLRLIYYQFVRSVRRGLGQRYNVA